MTTLTTQLAAADVLDQVADVILRDGHAKGRLGVGTEPKCVIGAIVYVIEGDAATFLVDEPSELYLTCYDALTCEIRKVHRWNYPSLPRWNDSPRRTLDDVVNTCRAVARRLQEEDVSE